MREGHSFSEVKNYTLGQMSLFYCEAIKGRIGYIADVRAAVWSDGDGIKSYMKNLT